MIIEFNKYKYDGGSICPICSTFGDLVNSKDKDNIYYNYTCTLCGFEWYIVYKITSKTKYGEESTYVANYSKKNNRRIVAGGTPPKDSYDELKIALRDYNL